MRNLTDLVSLGDVVAISTTDLEGDLKPLHALRAFLDCYFKKEPFLLVQLGDLADKASGFPELVRFFLDNEKVINLGGNRDYNKIRLAQLNRRHIMRMLAAEIYYFDRLTVTDQKGLRYLNGIERFKAIGNFYSIGDSDGEKNYAHYLSWVDEGSAQTLLQFFSKKCDGLNQILNDRQGKPAKLLEAELSAFFPNQGNEKKDFECDVLYWMLTHTMGTRRGGQDSYVVTFAAKLGIEENKSYEQLTREQKHQVLAEYKKAIRPGGEFYRLITQLNLFAYINGVLYCHGFPASLSVVEKMAAFLGVHPLDSNEMYSVPQALRFLAAIHKEICRIIVDYFDQIKKTGETAFTEGMQRLQYLIVPAALGMTSIQTQTRYNQVQEGLGVPLICGHHPIVSGPFTVITKKGDLVSLTDSQNSRDQPEQAGGYLAINTPSLRLLLKLDTKGKITRAYPMLRLLSTGNYDSNLLSLPKTLRKAILKRPQCACLSKIDVSLLKHIGMPALVDPHFKPLIEQHGWGLPRFVETPATAFIQTVYWKNEELMYEVQVVGVGRSTGFLARSYLVPASAITIIEPALQPTLEKQWVDNNLVKAAIIKINNALEAFQNARLREAKMADIKRTLVLRNNEKESATVPRTGQEAISRWLNLALSIIKNIQV